MKKLLFLPLLVMSMITGCNKSTNNTVSGTLKEREVLTVDGDIYATHKLEISNAYCSSNNYGNYYANSVSYSNGDFYITYNLTTDIVKVVVRDIGTFYYYNVTWKLSRVQV